MRALAREPDPLVLAKATNRSPIHRPAYLDYIGVKKFDDERQRRSASGASSASTRRGAYREVPANIPVLRRKAQAVRERAGFPPGSHDDKALIEVIDTFPRDELFQIGVEDLYEIAVGILELGERQRVRLFMRTDRYERFVSCLVFIPRDRFNTANRIKIGEILSEALGAESLDWGLRLTEWVLVRIHYTLRLPADVRPDFDADELEARIVEADALVGRRPARGAAGGDSARSAGWRSTASTAPRSRPPTATSCSPARPSPTCSGSRG